MPAKIVCVRNKKNKKDGISGRARLFEVVEHVKQVNRDRYQRASCYAALEQKRKAEAAADDKERRMQKAALELQAKFGKNVVLKGMNLREGAMAVARNGQIGGHRAE